MYNMEIKQADKMFIINVSGFIKLEEAQNLMKDLKSHIARIPNPSEYHFIIDGKEQKTVPPEVQTVLAEALALYINTPFKSRHTVVIDSAITKAQVVRTNPKFAEVFEFHNSIEQAIASCRKMAGAR